MYWCGDEMRKHATIVGLHILFLLKNCYIFSETICWWCRREGCVIQYVPALCVQPEGLPVCAAAYHERRSVYRRRDQWVL